MYKVQRTNSKLFVTVDTLKQAQSIAREDAKQNGTTLDIKVKRGARWFLVETVKMEENIMTEKVKLWKVKVNAWGWIAPRSLFAKSAEEARDIASKFSASDPVKYAGRFNPDYARDLLEMTRYEINGEW